MILPIQTSGGRKNRTEQDREWMKSAEEWEVWAAGARREAEQSIISRWLVVPPSSASGGKQGLDLPPHRHKDRETRQIIVLFNEHEQYGTWDRLGRNRGSIYSGKCQSKE